MKRSIFFLIGLLFLWVGPASAEVYTWTDDSGEVHFSDNEAAVPPEYQDRVKISKPVKRKSDSWGLSRPGAVLPSMKKEKSEGPPSISEFVRTFGIVKFAGAFLLFGVIALLIQIIILKKGAVLVGEEEPLGLGFCLSMLIPINVLHSAPQIVLNIFFRDVELMLLGFGPVVLVLIAFVHSFLAYVPVLRIGHTETFEGAIKIWLGMLVMSLFLGIIVGLLSALLSFCSIFMQAS